MRLYLAEKPSLGRAIAAVLPEPRKAIGKTHIELGNGDVVAWSAGHILAQSPPEAYGERYKAWSLDTLPIVPNDWKLVVKSETRDLFDNIKRLLKTAAEVVNAGDPDREGQLLIDEILYHFGYKGPVKRLLINDYNPEAVRRAIEGMRPNEEFRGLYFAALARARADWLHGMNMTRLYTKLAQAKGFRGVLKIGRVKTPVVALVVRRDREIESFIPKPYIHFAAEFAFSRGQIRAIWRPDESQVGLDEEGRLIDRSVAADLKERIERKPSEVAKCETKPKKTPPPLGYTLPALQVDCSKSYEIPAHETLKIAQGLYESGIITYPRSDCGFLPGGHHAQAADVIANIVHTAPGLGTLAMSEKIDLSRRAKAFDDAQVAEHHAIIPTPETKRPRALTPEEEKVYDLIARRYISLFLPDNLCNVTTVEVKVEGETFIARGRQVVEPGWKIALAGKESEEDEGEKGSDGKDEELTEIPRLTEGEAGLCERAILTDKKTTPPARFTEASLIEAMNSVHKFVQDSETKKILRETDGIGTAATQAVILKELFDSGQLRKEKKKVFSTDTARALIDVLPHEITLPDLTALWELQFRSIVEGGANLGDVMTGISEKISRFVAGAKESGGISLPSNASSEGAKGKKSSAETAQKCPDCGADLRHLVKRADKKDARSWDFFACTSCPAKFNSLGGKPVKKNTSATAADKTCPKCGKPMARRTGRGKDGKAYDFWGCTGYPVCKQTEKVG